MPWCPVMQTVDAIVEAGLKTQVKIEEKIP